MSKLELLNLIAQGRSEFTRADFPNLEDIDAKLAELLDLGYVWKVVRAVSHRTGEAKILRLDITRGLTPKGEKYLTDKARKSSSTA